ncbi:hypothetical protein [uncultured Massilia sp.]|uniref:hypothetical protein n=1 Tax=uncultured Massilia sp. TaxID=169973 RepID=UPI0025F5E152|nr:hypothetical protein [uncultured Massilia sp.]
MERRTDYKMALLIDATIHEAIARGRPAARELAAMGVPFEVAIRVLTRPEERRHPLPAAQFRRGTS